MARRICWPSRQLGLEFSILWGIERGWNRGPDGCSGSGRADARFRPPPDAVGAAQFSATVPATERGEAVRCYRYILRVVIFVTAVPSVQRKELNNGTITCRQFLASGQANMAALISWLRGGFRRARSVASLAASTNSTAHTRSCSITSGSVANFARALHRLHSE